MSQEQFPKGILARVNPNAEASDFPQDFPAAEDVVAVHYESGDFERASASNPGKEWARNELTDIAERSLSEMCQLEDAANDKERWGRISPETAKSIKRIIVFSAPGTYSQPVKDDRYKDKEWAWGMDRIRSDHAARLGIFLSGLAKGEDFSEFDSDELLNANDPVIKDVRERAKKIVAESDLRFTYIARPDEAEATLEALRSPLSFIPKEKVDMLAGPQINNTIDQVKAIKEYLSSANDVRPGDSVVFVAHGPQLVRMAGMLENYKSIPEGLTTYFDPVETPKLGLHEYPFMETKGKLFYTIAGNSSPQSCSYKILGQ